MWAKVFAVFALVAASVNGIISDFEINDGNAIDNGGADWASLNSQTRIFTGIISDPAPLTTFSGGGSKDTNDIPRWRHGNSAVPDKNDISNAYAYGAPYGDDFYVYFGADRFDNGGTSAVAVWLFQDNVEPLSNGKFSGAHKNGDLFIVSNYDSTLTIEIYRWVDGDLVLELSDADARCDAARNQSACAITNDVTTPSPWPYAAKSGEVNEFPPLTFFEGAVNLRAIFPGDSAPCFASIMFETRSSTSLTAQLKDFVVARFDICRIDASIACTDVSLNAARDGLVYSYDISVENTGFGTLYDATAYCNDVSVGSWPLLHPGDSKTISGTFSSTSLNETTQTAQVRANKVTAPTSESDLVTAVAAPSLCPQLIPNPAVNISVDCDVSLEVLNNVLVVNSNYSGRVCNSGDVKLTGVSINGLHVIDIGELNYNQCAAYGQKFYPLSSSVSESVHVYAHSALGSASANDSADMYCVLC